MRRLRIPRCHVESVIVEDDSCVFARVWVLYMPCGRIKHSHAGEPPVTVACSRTCKIAQAPRKRPALEF